jgi:uncharacterized protein (DUF305 family)
MLGAALALASMTYAQDGHMHHLHSPGASAADDSFGAQMGRVMERMNRDMMVPPSGNEDRDFAAMMVPHHQGAVDMARIELQYGKDPVLRRLAQAIIVEQLQEIEVMQRKLQQLPAGSSQPEKPDPSTHGHKNL